jgi:uncharacterized protein
MAAAFDLFKGQDGQYYWTLFAANNEPILQSEGYQSKQGAENGIAAVKQAAPLDQQYVKNGTGPFYFTLKAVGNNEILGTSEQYSAYAGMEKGIASVKANAPTAPIQNRPDKA